MFFDEITASSLVKIDPGGNSGEIALNVNAAGFIIARAIHGARHDASACFHTHTANGVAVATTVRASPISQHSLFVLNSVGYHDYEGPRSTPTRSRLVADLGDNRCLILATTAF